MDERIVIKDTPEKYAEMAKVIVPPFLELMKTLTDLEDKAFVRSGELDAERPKWASRVRSYIRAIWSL